MKKHKLMDMENNCPAKARFRGYISDANSMLRGETSYNTKHDFLSGLRTAKISNGYKVVLGDCHIHIDSKSSVGEFTSLGISKMNDGLNHVYIRNSTIGADCFIANNTRITNSIVRHYAHIHKNVVLENMLIPPCVNVIQTPIVLRRGDLTLTVFIGNTISTYSEKQDLCIILGGGANCLQQIAVEEKLFSTEGRKEFNRLQDIFSIKDVKYLIGMIKDNSH